MTAADNRFAGCAALGVGALVGALGGAYLAACDYVQCTLSTFAIFCMYVEDLKKEKKSIDSDKEQKKEQGR